MEQQDLHQPMDLPPGFRFHPTDEELITQYLARKVADPGFTALAVGEADLNKSEPWDLPSLAKMGEKEWYFFCLKDRKYPTGLRTNRATEAGYWKATGKDKDIFRGKTLVGSKKTLVFYTGRAPRGEKSGWVMHEYRLHGKINGFPRAASSKNEWVLSRVFKKNLAGILVPPPAPSAAKKGAGEMARMDDMVMAHLPTLMDMSGGATGNPAAAHVTCFSNALEGQFCFNQTTEPQAAAAATGGSFTDHASLGSSSPFMANFAQYGQMHQGVSLVQLLESRGYVGEQRQAPALPCKQGERERLSASQDTGLTSDVNPEISSSSGQKFDQNQLWGY